MRLVDTHLHLLPNVDDGPKDWRTVEIMLVEMAVKGVEVAVATPHVDDSEIPKQALEKQAALQELQELGQRFGIHIVGGAEFWISPDLPNQLTDLQTLTYGGMGKYVLVEFPLLEMPLFAEWVIFALKAKGITPLIAHPERYAWVQRDEQTLWKLLGRGALMQVVATSVLNEGEPEGRLAWRWLREGIVDCLASDWHNPNSTPYLLTEAIQKVNEELGEAVANRLGWEIPWAIVTGQTVRPAWQNSRHALKIRIQMNDADDKLIPWWRRWLARWKR